jgi:hypothetical protein
MKLQKLMSELLELDAEMTEAEVMRQAFDALTHIAEAQAEIIHNQREEIDRLNAIIEYIAS